MLQKNKIQLLIVIFLGLSFQTAYSVSTSAEVKEYFCQLYEDKSGEMISGDYSYSDEEVSDAKDFVKGKIGDENYLDLYINDEISESELIEQLIKLCIPAFVVFGIALLCTILCGVRWILACCCCCCCKKNKEKYIAKGEEIKISKFRYGLPMVINIIGFIMLIVCSIIGIIRGLKFFNGYYMAQCQISSFFDDFNAENTEEDWVGLIKLSRILKEVQTDFITEVNNAFGGNVGDFIQDDYDTLSGQNDNLEPTTTGHQYNNDGGAKYYSSDFYTSRYGPKIVDGSHLYVIDKIVVDGVSILRDSLQEVQDSGESILGGDGGASFTQTLKDGDEQIQDFIKQIDDSSVDFYDSGTSIDDSTLDLVEQGIAAYFGVCLLFGLISTASGMCVLYKKKYCCNFFLCFGAILQVLFGLVGAILLAVFYATVQASLMACDYSFQVITEYPKFQELKLGEDINTKVQICSAQYGGDGNIVAEFNIEDQIQNLKELTQNINDSISTFSEQKSTFDDADATFQEALDNLDQLIETFAYTDFDGSEKTDISATLDSEIDLSNNRQTYCTDEASYFVYDDDNCSTYPLGDFYQIADTSQTPPNGQCYNLNEYEDKNWTGAYTLNRSSGNCFQGNTGLLDTMKVIKNKNEYSIDNYNDVDGLKTAVSDYYNVKSKNYIDGIQSMSNNIDSLLNDIEVLTGVDDGSAGNLNCLFVGQAISDINSAMCVDTIPDMYWFSITLLCNSIAIIISYFGAICARFRFQEKEIDEKINKKIKKNENKQQQVPANQQYDQNYTKY